MWKKRVRNKRMETNFTKLHLIAKLNSAFLTLWQLFSIFCFACYPFFGSFTIFNSTFLENFKTILFLNLLKVH